MSEQRIYIVSEFKSPEIPKPVEYVVKAGSQAQALRRVIGTRFGVRTAKPTELAHLLTDGKHEVLKANDSE
jgi:hypothetical protein